MNLFDSGKTETNKLILIRACSTDLEEQGRIMGTLDVPLNQQGQIEATEIAAELTDSGVSLIFSAPCMAARQTAELISKTLKIKMKVEESWTNLDHGLWHGKCLEELKENQPKIFKKLQDDPGSVRPPDGETFEEAANRIFASVKRIQKKTKKTVIGIVAPAPLDEIIRSIVEESTGESDSGSAKQQSLRWEMIQFAEPIA